jgi:hypothetical protein
MHIMVNMKNLLQAWFQVSAARALTAATSLPTHIIQLCYEIAQHPWSVAANG